MLTIISIDTEYDRFPVRSRPFIATMADSDGNTVLLYLDTPKDYYKCKQICEDPAIIKVFHTASNDIFALNTIGIQVVPPFEDTFMVAAIIDENFAKLGLKKLAKRHLNFSCENQADLQKYTRKLKKKYGGDFLYSKIPKEYMEPYAVEDAVMTIDLWEKIYKKHISECQEVYTLEKKLVPVVVKMMNRGHMIDRDFCSYEIKNLKIKAAEAYNRLIKVAKKIINPGSAKDIELLFKNLGVNIQNRTATGKPKTDEKTLNNLSELYPVLKNILIYKKCFKQINTYYEPLITRYTTLYEPVAHFQFYQTGTRTGRFSAELIQTIPKETNNRALVTNKVRKAFISRPDYTNLYIDYDQIEMKIFAHCTNNKSLIKIIREGFDPHLATAIDLFGEGILKNKKTKKEYRNKAKTINFGMIYGMGTDALCDNLGLSRRDGLLLLQKYDTKYRIKSYIREKSSEIYRKGYIQLDWINRRYSLTPQMAYKAVNSEVQGSAAYVLKLAMLRISRYLQLHNMWGINILLQVHDELVFEVHNSYNLIRIAKILKKLMEDYTTFKVPITVDVEYSDTNWLEKKGLKF